MSTHREGGDLLGSFEALGGGGVRFGGLGGFTGVLIDLCVVK